MILGAGVALRLNGPQILRLLRLVVLDGRLSHEHPVRHGVLAQTLLAEYLPDEQDGVQMDVTWPPPTRDRRSTYSSRIRHLQLRLYS